MARLMHMAAQYLPQRGLEQMGGGMVALGRVDNFGIQRGVGDSRRDFAGQHNAVVQILPAGGLLTVGNLKNAGRLNNQSL